MASRRREELSDISTTESCLHASSLHFETIPVLSNPVLSFSLFSPATYHRFHFPDRVTWKIPQSPPNLLCLNTCKHTKEWLVVRDGKSKGAGKRTMDLFGSNVSFGRAAVLMRCNKLRSQLYWATVYQGEAGSLTSQAWEDEFRFGRRGSWSHQHLRRVFIQRRRQMWFSEETVQAAEGSHILQRQTRRDGITTNSHVHTQFIFLLFCCTCYEAMKIIHYSTFIQFNMINILINKTLKSFHSWVNLQQIIRLQRCFEENKHDLFFSL